MQVEILARKLLRRSRKRWENTINSRRIRWEGCAEKYKIIIDKQS
jgi:hypothetical protein